MAEAKMIQHETRSKKMEQKRGRKTERVNEQKAELYVKIGVH